MFIIEHQLQGDWDSERVDLFVEHLRNNRGLKYIHIWDQQQEQDKIANVLALWLWFNHIRNFSKPKLLPNHKLNWPSVLVLSGFLSLQPVSKQQPVAIRANQAAKLNK